ncbi:formimidoylglutamate deiminase, partial [Streptomyces rochei]
MTTTERTRTYWLEHAWLGTHVEPGVAVEGRWGGENRGPPPPHPPPPPLAGE